MKIFIVGDAGWDTYLIGKVRGLSAEAPIPVVDVAQPETLPGMAGNVLANVRALGIDAEVLQPEGQNLPWKFRLITPEGHQLARFDFQDFCKPLQRADLLPLVDADAVIVADYGKGAIDSTVTSILAGMQAPLFVDTKRDPSPWLQSNAILFPNQTEWDKYRDKYEWLPRVVLKQGSQGMSFVEYGKVVATRPAWAKQVQCVNGAGDTVIAAFATAYLGLQSSIQHCLDVASAAAALVVEQDFLHRTTTGEEIYRRIANEVPEKAYRPDQTPSRSMPAISHVWQLGVASPFPQQTAREGRGPYRGTSPMGHTGYNDAQLKQAVGLPDDYWDRLEQSIEEQFNWQD